VLALWLLGSAIIDRTLWATLAKTVLASAVMSAVALSLYAAPLPLAIAAGGAVYVGVTLLLGALPADDLRQVRRTVDAALAARWTR